MFMKESETLKWFTTNEQLHGQRKLSSSSSVDNRFSLSVIIPTRNEAGNIIPLLSRIGRAVAGISTEVIFVDDSSDDTAEVIRNSISNSRMQVNLIVRPPGQRLGGLGGAVVEGLRAAHGTWACVMDADLQHPPELIPRILRQGEESGADIVVGSRLAPGGDASSLGFKRSLISRLFAFMARTVFPMRLQDVTDPLSGFFLVRRSAIDLDRLRPNGFKILLEIAVRFPELAISEIPIQFGFRHAGESKASIYETIRFFRMLMKLRIMVDQKLLRFLFVGASGLVVNSAVLAFLKEYAGLHYLWSAVVATQCSTLWNFALTEKWVFGVRKTERSFLVRMSSFLFMNNVLLLLRAPILTFLVSFMAINYLISNLISLLALTLIRYLVADQWIWAKPAGQFNPAQTQSIYRRFAEMFNKRKVTQKYTSPKTKQFQPENFGFNYSIHNIIRVTSMFKLPELEYFRVSELSGDPDIRLRLERRHRDRRRKNANPFKEAIVNQRRTPRRNGKTIHYAESMGRLGFEVSIDYKNCVEVSVSQILGRSLHVLYTNVIEPILRWALVRKDYVLLHAACVAVDGLAVLVTAQTDTGKTSTILRAVDNYSCSFLSDDMTIVNRNGEVWSYPKPLTISSHTLTSVNGSATLSVFEKIALQIQSRLHSRSGRRIGLRLSETRLPAATMNTIVQMIIPPPKYMVDRLIPSVSYVDRATLAGAVVIERGPEFEEILGHDQAIEEFVHNAEDAYGFPPYPVLADSLSSWQEEDLHPREQSIIADALERVNTTRLRDPKFNWWRQLPFLAQGANYSPIIVDAVSD
jgi:glycosyltransferase involved in cell wall biosynthesis